jgi:hypothetical protein
MTLKKLDYNVSECPRMSYNVPECSERAAMLTRMLILLRMPGEMLGWMGMIERVLLNPISSSVTHE